MLTSTPAPGGLCAFCEMGMGVLKTALTTNITQAAVQAWLDRWCLKAPSMYAAQCQAFKTKYVVVIVRMLQGKATPKQICQVHGYISPIFTSFLGETR